MLKSQTEAEQIYNKSPWKNLNKEPHNNPQTQETKLDKQKSEKLEKSPNNTEKKITKIPKSYEGERKMANTKISSPTTANSSSLRNFGKISKIFIFNMFKDKETDTNRVKLNETISTLYGEFLFFCREKK